MQSISDNTFVCVAETRSLRVDRIISNGKHNVVKVDWVIRSLGTDDVLSSRPKLQPSDMMFATFELLSKFSKDFDVYGDSFTAEYSLKECADFVNKLNYDDFPHFTSGEFRELEKELAIESTKLFRSTTAYFVPSSNCDSASDFNLAKFIFKFHAGRLIEPSNDVDEFVTYLFTDGSFEREKFRQLRCSKILSFEWILKCHKENNLVDENQFLIQV